MDIPEPIEVRTAADAGLTPRLGPLHIHPPPPQQPRGPDGRLFPAKRGRGRPRGSKNRRVLKAQPQPGPPPPPDPTMMAVRLDECARRLGGVPTSTVQKLIREGVLKSLKVGRTRVVSVKEIESFLTTAK